MSPEVRKTPDAFHDLAALSAYIARDNPHAAVRFLESLEYRFRLLAVSPGIGRLWPDLGTDIRAFPVKDYLIQNFKLDEKRFKTVGHGAENPVAANTSEAGRQQNRRTDIKVILNVQ